MKTLTANIGSLTLSYRLLFSDWLLKEMVHFFKIDLTRLFRLSLWKRLKSIDFMVVQNRWKKYLHDCYSKDIDWFGQLSRDRGQSLILYFMEWRTSIYVIWNSSLRKICHFILIYLLNPLFDHFQPEL